jgi:hypothetical protein
MTGLFARRHRSARWFRAFAPVAKSGIARVGSLPLEALISNLRRPKMHISVGRNRGECRKGSRRRRTNQELPHNFSPSKFSVMPAPGRLVVTWLHWRRIIFTMTNVSKIYASATIIL